MSGRKGWRQQRRVPDATERQALTEDFVKRHAAGASIRRISKETGWSYGFVQRHLDAVDVRRPAHRPKANAKVSS